MRTALVTAIALVAIAIPVGVAGTPRPPRSSRS